MRKSFKYRLYPTKRQALFLEGQLSEGCRLYNAALQERRDAYRRAGKSLNYFDQANQLKEIRASEALELANFSCCQDILRRVDKAFRAFFARIKRGDKPGFPRFKSWRRFDSLTFPSYGDGARLLESGRLRIQGAGQIKMKLHRPVAGKIKTVTVKREITKWYACFSVECESEPLSGTGQAVGIDVGLDHFAVLSNGTSVDNPRYGRATQFRLRRAGRRVARRKKGSHRRRKAVCLLQKIHQHTRNQRSDFHHKLSRRIINQYDLIAVEDLNLKGLAGSRLAKSIHDAGWASFIEKLAYKAEEAGRQLVKIDPRGTSQRCVCGADNPKNLSQRWHHCSACGLSASRDHVSAQIILRLGLSLRDITWATLAVRVPRSRLLELTE